jgi:hypothetical protein
MRPLIRSLFLLSLAASPLALAGVPAQVVNASNAVATATASGSTSQDVDEAALRTQVQELEAAVADARRELAQVRTQDEVNANVVGDRDDHPLWP